MRVDGRIDNITHELSRFRTFSKDIDAGPQGELFDLKTRILGAAVIIEDHFFFQIQRRTFHSVFQHKGGFFKCRLAADAGLLADGIDQNLVHKSLQRRLISFEFDLVHPPLTVFQRQRMWSVQQLVAVAFSVEFTEDFKNLGHEGGGDGCQPS